MQKGVPGGCFPNCNLDNQRTIAHRKDISVTEPGRGEAVQKWGPNLEKVQGGNMRVTQSRQHRRIRGRRNTQQKNPVSHWEDPLQLWTLHGGPTSDTRLYRLKIKRTWRGSLHLKWNVASYKYMGNSFIRTKASICMEESNIMTSIRCVRTYW